MLTMLKVQLLEIAKFVVPALISPPPALISNEDLVDLVESNKDAPLSSGFEMFMLGWRRQNMDITDTPKKMKIR